MKVSELTGAELDCWVARAEKIEAHLAGPFCVFRGAGQPAIPVSRSITLSTKSKSGLSGRGKEQPQEIGWLYAPSQDWAQGGPILQRENISLDTQRKLADGRIGWAAYIGDYPFDSGSRPHDTILQFGLTPLEAAMRCYLTAKYGEEVPEIPE